MRINMFSYNYLQGFEELYGLLGVPNPNTDQVLNYFEKVQLYHVYDSHVHGTTAEHVK